MRSVKNRPGCRGVLGASICFLLLGLATRDPAAATEPAEAPGYRVIVHRDNPAESILRQRVSLIMLKESSRWDHGLEAKPVDLGSGSPVRESFSRAVHGRSVSSIKNYWQRQISSNRAEPPPEVSSDAEVVAYVRSHPGGIGYVSLQAKLDGVKVVRVVGGELPP